MTIGQTPPRTPTLWRKSSHSTLDEGRRRKAEALEDLEDIRADIIIQGRRALLLSMLESPTGTATADDVRERIDLPPGISPKCLGPVPIPLGKAGIIKSAGYTESRRPVAHARPVRIWKLINRDAALHWLEANQIGGAS